MKILIRSKLAILSLLAFSSAACTVLPEDSNAAPFQQMVTQQSFAICPIVLAQGKHVVADAKTWSAMHTKLTPTPLAAWKPNFVKDRIVAFSMGEKRSGGFSTAIASTLLDRDVLTIKIEQKVPATGSINSAQLTSPCVLALIDVGNAKTIQLIDAITGGVL